MATFQATETFLIECSRERSLINIEDNENTNGSWSNQTDMLLKRGDKISVEMVCANIRGSGTGAPTIEFSGQNVVVNGENKLYCDTKCLLEVFFYMNNNNTYSVGLPLLHPRGGLNGAGGTGGVGYQNTVMPTNLNPRIPYGQTTNQVNNYRELNEGFGYVSKKYIGAGTAADPHEIVPFFQTPIGTGAKAPAAQRPEQWCYQVYQYEVVTIATSVGVWGTTMPNDLLTRCGGIRILPYAAVVIPQTPVPGFAGVIPGLYTDFNNGVICGRTGYNYQNNFYPGNEVYVNNNNLGSTYDTDWVGTINAIRGVSGLGNPAFGVDLLEVMFASSNTPNPPQNPQRKFQWEAGDVCAYVGGISLEVPGATTFGYWNPLWDIPAGSSQEGMVNYDNLNLERIATGGGTTPALQYAPGAFMRGNNALFIYSRNTQKIRTGQQNYYNNFPDTEFLPPVTFFTRDAGEYGAGVTGREFGYRNANIQQENNNEPYIFMRNDHFGSGRLGMNGEQMPLAEPMTAFIYISIEELLQDINSLTNTINERLRETITGIGTTIQQTGDLLMNNIENPSTYKPMSNVTPYYNVMGFYDPAVTLAGQDARLKQDVNHPYRNIFTNIIPIKNGGCCKVNPANFTSGKDLLVQNYGKQTGGLITNDVLSGHNPTQEELILVKESTYLREIETSAIQSVDLPADTLGLASVNMEGWANPIYGNMATADLYKYQLGDRLARIPVNQCNFLFQSATLTDPPLKRDIGKIVILNQQLLYKEIQMPYPSGANGYDPPLGTIAPLSTPVVLDVNDLFENQIIYTNIEFPTFDTASKDFEELAKSLRKYESYYNKSDSAPVEYKTQLLDIGNWVFDGDVGNTDDHTTAQMRQMPAQPGVSAPNSQGAAEGGIRSIFQNNRPMIYDWMQYPPPAAAVLNATATGLGLPATDYEAVPPILPNFQSDAYRVNRTIICPTTSHEAFAGISARNHVDQELKYRLLKELGRLKIKSRFNPKFRDIVKNYRGQLFTISSAAPVDPNDAGFNLANNQPTLAENVDTTFVQQLDLPFYPYYAKTQNLNPDGSTKYELLTAIFVGTDYDAKESDLASINFGSICWGNTIGVSNNFFDNHAICPMNNDEIKTASKLTDTTTTSGSWETIAFQIATDYQPGYIVPTDAQLLSGIYTQTTGINPDNRITIFDVTTPRLVAPYLSPGLKNKYRLTLTSGGGEASGTWEQSSELTGTVPATGYSPVSIPASWNVTGGYVKNFNGLYRNQNFASTGGSPNFPYLLTSGDGDPNSNNPDLLGSAWGCLICENGGGLYPPPIVLPGTPYANFSNHRAQFGAFDPNDRDHNLNEGQMMLEIYKYPQITPTGTPIPPNPGIQWNKVNYIWSGATQPTFQYNPDKGRVEFVQLQEDNIMNERSIPYVKASAAANAAAGTGVKAAIINTATEDAVFSRNTITEDLAFGDQDTPVPNQGMRAEIGGVGIYNIFLCPETYNPPNNINLSSYWNNKAGLGEYPERFWDGTKRNRDKIIAGCVLADEDNWTGSLFSRLGFQSHREILPAYGKQKNRFNPTTYNQTTPDKISRSTKPLILCNAIDNTINPAMNTFFTEDTTSTDINGVPMYSHGFLNNENISIAVENQTLTATAPPILSTSPFLLIESDICQTNYRSGATQQNVLFYLMKNYQASSFIYGYGSSYSHTINQDRTLSLINTAFRDPITGRLQKCSNNSTIIYKIERQTVIPPPTTTATGVPLNLKAPESSTDKLLEQLIENTNPTKGAGQSGEGLGARPGEGSASQLQVAIQQLPVGATDERLINMTLQQGGAANQIVAGELAAQQLTTTFAEIDQDDNIPLDDKDIVKGFAFVVAQLLRRYPMELVTTEDGQIRPALLDGSINSLSSLSANVITWLEREISGIGGIKAIEELLTSNEGAEKLADRIDSIAMNPETLQPVGAEERLNGQFGVLGYSNSGSGSILRLGQLFYEIEQEIDDFQDLQTNPAREGERIINQQTLEATEEMMGRKSSTLREELEGELENSRQAAAAVFEAAILSKRVTLNSAKGDPLGGLGGFSVPFLESGNLQDLIDPALVSLMRPEGEGVADIERYERDARRKEGKERKGEDENPLMGGNGRGYVEGIIARVGRSGESKDDRVGKARRKAVNETIPAPETVVKPDGRPTTKKE